MSSPRFQPLLMPETTRSGIDALSRIAHARLTQSVGVPSTPKTLSLIVSMRSGRRSVSAWPIALASCNGATTSTSPSGFMASASA